MNVKGDSGGQTQGQQGAQGAQDQGQTQAQGQTQGQAQGQTQDQGQTQGQQGAQDQTTENLLAGGADDGAAGEKGAGDGGEGAIENLLADEGGAEKPAEVTEQQVAEYLKQMPALDLGSGMDGEPIRWDDEALKAIAPELIRQKLAPAQANAIVKSYAEYVQAQHRKAQEGAAAWNKKLVTEAREKFGADLGRFAKEARAGGLHVFGADLWKEISQVTNFTNDWRVIERLAAVGRTITADAGVGSGGGASRQDDFAERYLRSSLG